VTLADGPLYLDDAYSAVVEIKDGRPVMYASRARASDEAALVALIRAKTGFGVRLGEWVEDPPGDPRDTGFNVALTVDD
jgi:hypothetical protein